MGDLVRLSFSVEDSLFRRLEQLVEDHGYRNRSEFVRDLIREQVVEKQWREDQEVVGTITLLYDHHQRLLSEKLTELQHQYHDLILVSTHVHLDEEVCTEAIIVRGSAEKTREIADTLRKQKGVLHCELSFSSTGRQLQ